MLHTVSCIQPGSLQQLPDITGRKCSFVTFFIFLEVSAVSKYGLCDNMTLNIRVLPEFVYESLNSKDTHAMNTYI